MRRLGFLLFATSVLAQSQIQQLSEVVLTAQRINSPISPLSFTLVSDSLGGLLQQEIGEQLGIVPSLFVSSQQNFTQDTRISIRGFGTRAAFGIRGVKVLLDGVPISTPDGQAQLDHIPLLQLGGVAVIRGLSSGLYGNASGGVLLLKSAPITNKKKLIATLGSFDLKRRNNQELAACYSIRASHLTKKPSCFHKRSIRDSLFVFCEQLWHGTYFFR